MLSVIKLADAEYTIGQVALGIEEYYLGEGEAPGVWAGRWAPTLGLEGVVAADDLRSLVNGIDPRDRTWWLEGRPARRVNAFDATFSAPKSASVLWAFGSPEVASTVSRAHVEAVTEALAFLEDKAAVSRQQTDRVRTRVGTHGFAAATFVHRTSRAGDPQLHTHCVVPNVVCRADGSYASIDGAVVYTWAKAAGSVYQEQLRRILSDELGVEWGPDRNGCREMVGFTADQLRTFSKRTSQIDTYLERSGGVYSTAVERMRADHLASLATRAVKDPTLSPERLRGRWADEAAAVGLDGSEVIERGVLGRYRHQPAVRFEAVAVALTDPDDGLCANDSRFGEAHVIERVAALGAGRLSVDQIRTLTAEFLASDDVVRLSVDVAEAVRTPPQFTTAAHLTLERRVIDRLDRLIGRHARGLDRGHVEGAIVAEAAGLGPDQADAVRVLCGPGPAVRSLIAPAGFGKTTAVHAAACGATMCGLPVVGVATTNRAVAELRDVGVPAMTIARLAMELTERPLAEGTVVICDELSQVATADAEIVLAAVAETPGAQLWCVGDVRQAQAVRAGGLAAEIDRLGRYAHIPAAVLVTNRRQHHPADRAALDLYRAGDIEASQAIRTDAGLDHEHPTPTQTRDAMADAVTADVLAHGPVGVIALAVSHADCEDIADRIRARLTAAGTITGPELEGPGWDTDPRCYQAGDRVLLHARAGTGAGRLHNGTTLTVTSVTHAGLRVSADDGAEVVLPAEFVTGRRRDGRPNVSHAWCRTVDGAQGGTWDHVHLLGTAALDNFTGYVGQSRARAATHTWCVAQLPAGDWGGQLADQRSAAERATDAMTRAPLKTFAAADDPHEIDRRLRTEIAEHQAVLAAAPPDVSDVLAGINQQFEFAERRIAQAQARLDHAQAQARAVGPIAALRRERRDSRTRWLEVVEAARADLDAANADIADQRHQITGLQEAAQTRRVWEAAEGWRPARLGDARAELDRHWADTVASAVAQDAPLAFGVERLRAARTTFAAELRRLDTELPPDRSGALANAEQALHNVAAIHRQAVRRHTEATHDVEDAQTRRFGRQDKTGVAAACRDLASTTDEVWRAASDLSQAQAKFRAEQAAVAARATADAAIADQRRQLRQNLGEVTEALVSTRPERIDDAAAGHRDGARLRDLLGDPPTDQAGRTAWCSLAERIDAAIDNPPATGRDDYIDHLIRQALNRHPERTRDLRLLITRAAGPAGPVRSAAQRSISDHVHEPGRPARHQSIDLDR